MKKRSNIKLWDIFRTIISAGIVMAIFINIAPVVSYGADRLVIQDDSDQTRLVVTQDGYLGVGTSVPIRQLHMAGSNAVFRMDRTQDTAAFLMVRTDVSGNPMKTFIVGANASDYNDGEFVIKDIGTAVSGDGPIRMRITNSGDVVFTGNVYALQHYNTSSIAFKNNVRTYENALETVSKLRGVRFDWKESGKPAVGLIAEEVEEVIPEVVAHDGGTANGVNYASLVGVLVEAVKEQKVKMQKQQKQHQVEMDSLKVEMQQLKALLQGKS